MPLTLDPQTEQRIQHEAELGHYDSPADLINDLLDRLHDSDDDGYLNSRIEIGLEQLQRGEMVPGSRIEEMILERRAKRAS